MVRLNKGIIAKNKGGKLTLKDKNGKFFETNRRYGDKQIQAFRQAGMVSFEVLPNGFAQRLTRDDKNLKKYHALNR